MSEVKVNTEAMAEERANKDRRDEKKRNSAAWAAVIAAGVTGLCIILANTEWVQAAGVRAEEKPTTGWEERVTATAKRAGFADGRAFRIENVKPSQALVSSTRETYEVASQRLETVYETAYLAAYKDGLPKKPQIEVLEPNAELQKGNSVVRGTVGTVKIRIHPEIHQGDLRHLPSSIEAVACGYHIRMEPSDSTPVVDGFRFDLIRDEESGKYLYSATPEDAFQLNCQQEGRAYVAIGRGVQNPRSKYQFAEEFSNNDHYVKPEQSYWKTTLAVEFAFDCTSAD